MAHKKQNKDAKRFDKSRIKLREGESQRKNGTYDYRWTSPDGKRHSIYAATLEKLREQELSLIHISYVGHYPVAWDTVSAFW